MKCPKCGTENHQGRVLCVKCGARLRQSAPAGTVPTTPEAGVGLMERLRSDLRRLAVVLIVVVAVAVALGVVLR